jgi:mono/diheme cytochrome c family protein
MRRTSLIAGAAGFFLLAAQPCLADNLELPPGPGRDLVYGQCRTCHDLQNLKESAGIPRDSWNELLDSMKEYGLRITPEQRARILDYLGTYLGPNPPPASAAVAPAAKATAGKAPAAEATVDGASVFADQCAACHQLNGEGVAGQFPPLAHNADVFLSRDFPLRVVLFGLSGKIVVGGKNFDGVMPPLGEVLSDAQIAAAVTYVRGAWGNSGLRPKAMTPVDAAAVAALRGEKDMSSAAIFADRARLKAAAAKR